MVGPLRSGRFSKRDQAVMAAVCRHGGYTSARTVWGRSGIDQFDLLGNLAYTDPSWSLDLDCSMPSQGQSIDLGQ
jgi:hypothetical protein